MKIRRIFALLLIFAMVFALAVSASAEGSYTITIDKPEAGRTYKAYQIFTGDISNTEMTEIEWGTGVTSDGQSQLHAEYGVDTAQKVAGKLSDTAAAEIFAEKLSAYLQNPQFFTYNESTYTLSGLEAGYYLVVEETEVDDVDKSLSAYIMQVVKDVRVMPKDNHPTIEKKVSDINDSLNGEYINLVDSADHDIGDDVPFHIHVKLGNGISHYDEYKIVVTDTMSKGLDFNKDSLVVKLGTHTIPNNTNNYSVDTVETADGTTITITFNDLFALQNNDGTPWKDGEKEIVPNDGGNLILEYTATLNNDAVIGDLGNPNKVYMTYSNDPHGDSMGKSGEDTVKVFTYRLNVNKTDGNAPLNGAAFALYKNDFNGEWDLVKEFTVVDGVTTFSFVGLDDGEYKLVETVTPAGYNKIEDQIFDIVASHDDGTLTLTSLNGERSSGTIELTADLDDGTLSTTVVNEKGAVLPSTGGIGTTIFYVLGGVLVCGTVVLLITKKRMRYEA